MTLAIEDSKYKQLLSAVNIGEEGLGMRLLASYEWSKGQYSGPSHYNSLIVGTYIKYILAI